MIINDSDAVKRLSSPNNLMNKLKTINGSRKSAMSLFGVGRQTVTIAVSKPHNEELEISFNPFQTKEPLSPLVPTTTATQVPQAIKLDNLLENHESQIKLGLAHDHALDLLNKSVDMLASKLDDIKADKLPAVITAASKTVEG